jgi:ATP synthase F1, epsilon subunit
MAKKAAIEASKRNKIHEEQDILGTKKKIQSNLLRK